MNAACTTPTSGTWTMQLPYEFAGSKSSMPKKCISQSSRRTTAYGFGLVWR